MKIHKKFFGLLYFAATVAILIAILKVTNWLPTVLQEGVMRKYSSVEEIKSRLNIRDIYVPSYFPQSLKWPPSKLLAQSRPFVAVVMEFRNVETGDISLIISQAADKGFIPDRKITLAQVKERVAYPLKGRAALLEVGACKNDMSCSRISWDEGNYRVKVETKTTPFELIKIADSMLR